MIQKLALLSVLFSGIYAIWSRWFPARRQSASGSEVDGFRLGARRLPARSQTASGLALSSNRKASDNQRRGYTPMACIKKSRCNAGTLSSLTASAAVKS